MKGILFTWADGRSVAYVPLGAPFAVCHTGADDSDVRLGIGGQITVRFRPKINKKTELEGLLTKTLIDQKEGTFPLDNFVDWVHTQID